MWILLPDSFLSIVADSTNPNRTQLLVRARRPGDIEKVFPGAMVFSIPNSDYAFRTWISRQKVSEALAYHVNQMTYGNFKNSIADPIYHHAAERVWEALAYLQAPYEALSPSSE